MQVWEHRSPVTFSTGSPERTSFKTTAPPTHKLNKQKMTAQKKKVKRKNYSTQKKLKIKKAATAQFHIQDTDTDAVDMEPVHLQKDPSAALL